ncbi:MATE family efflux transporter [Psychrobacillus lasiicapitis]|uniref:Probable multidrug resistance protein NorM n=1 Tax=Psychrobacillus lasiicapitis TaxID=1636719 RepID=A0A544TH66_9BACI|nr:MATE family efflux transporter [Psychrobacillus lasiicapitis]TQR16802.1 MATE family efflux transporter [Psychrobacillus lasiicapitis]GGA27091.1 putative multidrug resistance protein NorM [Psychrobacillus lasiicapitis]
MYETKSLPEKSKYMIKIVVPILITQVALYLMTFFDILMTSKYSIDHLAGVSIGSSIWVPVYTGLTGILIGITPIVAQFIGAKKIEDVRTFVQQGFYIAIFLAFIVFLGILFLIDPVLNLIPLEDSVRLVAKKYLYMMCIGLIPLFLYSVLRSFIDALGKTRVSMFITLLSAPINIGLNYVFIYGKFGFPALGGVGAGLGSAVTYWLVLIIAIIIVYKNKPFAELMIFKFWRKPSFAKMGTLTKIGVPIGLALFAETTIFSAVTILMSKYSTEVISAHQIAMNFTSLLYMIPLSIAMGATILVGHEVGAKRYKDAKTYSWLSVGTAVFFSFISSSILLIFREPIAALYTDDQYVISLTVQFFLFAALFQLSDAIQAPVQGALRGYKDVTVTFIMAIISYWIIGLPTGYYLATYTSFERFGYWIGLIVGLTVGAITLVSRLIYLQRRVAKNDA